MNIVQNITIIPKKIVTEIRWYLKNYNDIDKYIQKRERTISEDLIDYYHYSNRNYLKSIHSSGMTLENTILACDEDKIIAKYKKMKEIIRSYMNDIDNKNDFITYWIVKYKYIDKRDNEFIKEHLNLNNYKLRQEIFIIFSDLYQRAIEKGIYEEVA